MEKGSTVKTENVGDNVSLWHLGIMVLRRRKAIVASLVIVTVLSLTWTWLHREHTATAVFAPQVGEDVSSRLLGLVGQFGVNFGRMPAESVDFYAWLAQSRSILERVAETEYEFREHRPHGKVRRGTILEIFGIRGETREAELRSATVMLQSSLAVQHERGAGLVTVAVTLEWAELAEKVTRRILELINIFNLEERQSQAQAERRFVGQRMEQAHRDLQDAERALRDFLEENRSLEGSPRLLFEQQQLQREVNLQQQVYTGLVQAYESARIEEVRDTPVITIIESPEGSARQSQSLFMAGFLGMAIGAIVGFVFVLVSEFLAREREDAPGEYHVFRQLVGETRSEMWRLPRGLAHGLRRAPRSN
jgi:uncharacterized protein involved in exopolysaccharide biosynthesis